MRLRVEFHGIEKSVKPVRYEGYIYSYSHDIKEQSIILTLYWAGIFISVKQGE